ncbi:(S)-2-hydroxypropylphosphonic acid epoxidase [termite gut metagenome]|uniref:(S)-2-hydroxypropylphosphonic acid epoxidase n=1 Tax=termite gut metagenome TaxID=433724 RepID=A0A5J4SD61_9ZZZZ
MDTNKIVGEKIKILRENRNITIEELAERSNLTLEQIERIENNIDIPSLAPLIKIARVLGVRLGTLLDDQNEEGAVICRKNEASETISFSNNATQLRKHMTYHSLSKSKANRHMEPFIIDVFPTDINDFALSSHEGEEFIIVMEGTMEISYGKDVYILEEGDSIYYDSIIPHHVHAYKGKAAKILAVVYTPF